MQSNARDFSDLPEDFYSEMEEDSQEKEVAAVGTPRLEQLAEYGSELETLKEELERLDAEKKVVQERYDQLRKVTIPEMMHAAGIAQDGKGTFTIGSGARLSLRNDLHVNVKKEDEGEKLFPWLRRAGLGGVIRETVHHQTLKATVKEIIADGKQVPEFVKVYHETAVVLTRGRKNS